MTARFSQGKYSLAISDRDGQAYPYNEMVREWTGAWVHISEYEPKSPQLEIKVTGGDPQALQRARPARTEFATEDFLPVDPFSTAASTTLTFRFPYGGLLVDDQVRFTAVKSAVGGVSVQALELNTTLNGNITDTATTITLTDASEFPTSGYIVIEKIDSTTGAYESETIEYTGKSSNDLTGCTRGTAAPSYGKTPISTTATSHSSGAKIYGSYIITIVETSFTNDANSVETYSNSFTCTLVNAATGTAIGGGFFVFGGPVNDRS